MIGPSLKNTIDNPRPDFIVACLKALVYDLQFMLPQIVIEILQRCDIVVTQFITNA